MRGYFNPDKTSNNLLSRFVLNDAPNVGQVDFDMCLRTVNSKSSYSIGFTDIPGEWVNRCQYLEAGIKEQLSSLVKEADVLIITIDSVLLMEEGGLNANSGNKIDNIDYLIRNFCNGSDENPYKMVLFVPVKCEKYYYQAREYESNPDSRMMYNENPMRTLIARIKEKYSSIFEYLQSPAQQHYFDVAILPMLTLGNIVFSTFKDSSSGDRTASNMLFTYRRKLQATTLDVSLPEFAPEFCEQPLVYLLLFQLAKIQKLKQEGKLGFFNFLGKWFRGMASDKALLAELPNVRQNIARENYESEIIQSPITNLNLHLSQNNKSK